MKFENVKEFFHLQYIQPTVEQVSKYSKIDQILGKRRSASTGGKRVLPSYKTQYQIKNDDPLYSSSSQSNFILNKNAWTYNQINQAVNNEKEKLSKIADSKVCANQKLFSAMPKINHTIALKCNFH